MLISEHNGVIRVLMIAPLPPPVGGIATWTRNILKFAQLRDDVIVFHVDSAVRSRRITQTSWHRRLTTGSVEAGRQLRQAWRAARSCHPDVLHLCSSASMSLMKDLLLVVGMRRLGIRTVVHWHFGRIPELMQRANWEWRLLTAVCRNADCVITIDEASAAVLRRQLPESDVRCIPNPVGQEFAVAWDTAEPLYPHRVVFVGHVLPSKGILELVEACTNVDIADLELHLIGPCEDDFASKVRQVAATRAGNWLQLRGVLTANAIIDALSASGVFVLPSYTEGFPNAILEAMAMGKAIIASRVGAIPEMLTPAGEPAAGLCVEPRNQAALCDAITLLLRDTDLNRRFGSQAHGRAMARYTMDQVFVRYRHCWAGEDATGDAH